MLGDAKRGTLRREGGKIGWEDKRNKEGRERRKEE